MRKMILIKRLQQYMRAEAAILTGAQSYSIGDRSLTRANLKEIQEEIEKLESELDMIDGRQRGLSKRVVID